MTNVDGLAQDLSISPDGNVAVVRTVSLFGVAGKVYVWDLTTDPPSLLNSSMDHASDPEGGDVIHAIEDRVLSLAAYVNTVTPEAPNIFGLSSAGVSLLSATTPGADDCWDAEVAFGGPNMEPIGAIRHRHNEVTVWNLKAATLYASPTSYFYLPRFSTLSACSNNYGSGDVFGTADCIKLTSTRLVAIANTRLPVGPGTLIDPPPIQSLMHYGGVGIANLEGTALFQFPTVPEPPNCQFPPGTGYYWVHDVTVSPDGSKAAVSGTDYVGVFNLRAGTEIGSLRGTQYPTPTFHMAPMSLATLDSVEMTNNLAVFIGNAFTFSTPPWMPAYTPTPPGDNESFEISIVAFNGTAITDQAGWTALGLLPGLPTPLRARACDLVITPNQSRAVVSTRRATVVFDLTVRPSVMTPTVVLTSADPLDFAPGAANPSDVVACTDSRAVVIGVRPRAGSMPQVMEGVIEVLDLLTPVQPVPPPPTPVLASIKGTVVIGDRYIPTDVVITPDGTRAIVRSMHATLGVGDAHKSRLSVVELMTGTLEFQTDGSEGPLGAAFGTDHLECTNDWVVSAGERVYVPQDQTSVQFLRLD